MVIFVILAIIVKLVMATNIPYSEQLEWVEGTRVMKTESGKKIIDRSADPAHDCAVLSPDYNAVWARCYLNSYWAWLPDILFFTFLEYRYLKPVSLHKEIHI